jgi:hypothetical protein
MTDTLSRVHIQKGSAIRVTRSLSPYALRLCRWPMLTAGIVGAWFVVWWRAGDVTTPSAAVWLVRGVAAIAAVAVVFALDDPSIDSTRALPTAKRVLMRLRLGVVLVTTLVALVPAVTVTWEYLDSASTAWGVVLEVCALLAVTTGVALLLQRQFRISEPAQFVVLAVVGVCLVAQTMGARWPMLPGPGPEWAEAHWRWAGLLVVAGSVVVWQLRDPASRGVRLLRQTARITRPAA